MNRTGLKLNFVKPNRSQQDVVGSSDFASYSTSTYLRAAAKSSLNDFPPQILHLDPHYCVINKPYDVRMDGDFDITVDKLVSSWLQVPEKSLKWIHQLDYATSGVLCIGLTREGSAAASSAFAHRLTDKQYLAVLQGHLSLDRWPSHNEPFEKSEFIDFSSRHRNKRKIKELKLAQREYTEEQEKSGKKIIVNNSEDPSIALGTYWQEELMKYNLELCYQSLYLLAQTTPLQPRSYSLPMITISEEQCRKFNELMEVKDTKKEKNLYFNNQKEYNRLLTLSFHDFIKSAKLRKLLRKLLQDCDVTLPLLDSNIESYQTLTASSTNTNIHENSENEKRDEPENMEEMEEQQRDIPSKVEGYSGITQDELSLLETDNFFAPDEYLRERCQYYQDNNNIPITNNNSNRSSPFIYRYKPSPATTTTTTSDSDPYSDRERLLIRIPLTEIEDEFRLEPSHPDEKKEEILEAATELIILDNNAYYQGQPVTKVLLRPLTGRRHQLRIHTLCLGHPIVGDFTYNFIYRRLLHDTFHQANRNAAEAVVSGGSVSEEERRLLVSQAMTPIACERMMLHAFTLRIPLSQTGEMKCSIQFRNEIIARNKVKNGEGSEKMEEGRVRSENYLVDVTSPDPFPIIDKILRPLLHSK